MCIRDRDALADKWNISVGKTKFQGLWGQGEVDGHKVVPVSYTHLDVYKRQVPLHCPDRVFCYTFSCPVAIAKITVRPTIALLRRFLIPFCRLNVVFFYANAVFIAVSKIALRIRITRCV